MKRKDRIRYHRIPYEIIGYENETDVTDKIPTPQKTDIKIINSNKKTQIVKGKATGKNVDIYVTGSNSRMMSSEISTYLTGRYVAFHISTLSFAEYLTFKGKYAKIRAPKSELADYVRLGGFPATHLQKYSQDEVYTIVRDIYNSTIAGEGNTKNTGEVLSCGYIT